ncbi:unnamed protein product [Urochloa decumbens]|uniref:KIB1-4 beta-propeller domain-containing protein n=1 Tax=Urochloa decumbens TaxID=240449 RepID=A0ABC8YW18_9POAL
MTANIVAAVPPASSCAPTCDWSQLPQDVLIKIFSQLQLPELVYSGAACMPWRLSYLAVRRLQLCSPNQSPYLIYSSSMYHVSLPDPPYRNRCIIGSSHGWLVTADEQSNLHLLNPLTGAQIALPSPRTMKGVTPSFTRDGVLSGYYIHSPDTESDDRADFFEPKKTRYSLYAKAILSSDPSGGDCIVLLLHQGWMHLSFARVGDTKWTWLDMEHHACLYYYDIFYDDDASLFYGVRVSGEIHSIDLSGPSPEVKGILGVFLPDANYETRYIVRSPWGDLLQVFRQYYIPGPYVPDSDDKYQVNDNQSNSQDQDCDDQPREDDLLDEQEYKEDDDQNQEDDLLDEHDYEDDGHDHDDDLSDDEQAQEEYYLKNGKLIVYNVDLAKQEVTKIKGLHDHALFIGFNNMFMVHSHDFPNIRPNCVYISDDVSDDTCYIPFSPGELGYLSLEDASLTIMPFSDSLLHWPSPVWFRPHLT